MRARALTGPGAKSAALIAVGAFAVHQLRYLVVNGGSSGSWPPGLDHNYVGHLLPLVLGIALAALTASAVRGLVAGREPTAERRVKATSYALGIVAVFFLQELLEGALIAGHASGLAAIFSAGGWAAVPLAALFGVFAALIDRGIEAIETLAARPPAMETRTTLVPPVRNSPLLAFSLLAPLAFGLARRPPPSLA